MKDIGLKMGKEMERNFDKAMYTFCKKLTMNSWEYYKESGMNYRPVFKTDGGRKYIRVKSFDKVFNGNDEGKAVYTNKGSIHCFVEKATGNVYKPASWRGPYLKGNQAVRGNIYRLDTYKNTDPHGGWLYAK